MRRVLRYALCVVAVTASAGCQLVVDFPRSLIGRDAGPQITDSGQDAKGDGSDPDGGGDGSVDDSGVDDGGADASVDAAQP